MKASIFVVGLVWLFDIDLVVLILVLYEFVDTEAGNAAELFERASQSIKLKRYSDALDDLNAAIEADPSLSEAYIRRASILRQLCRFFLHSIILFLFLLLNRVQFVTWHLTLC
jgi:DnaJ family protein C protein 3